MPYEEQLKQYGLINIDHHSDLPEMEQQISGTNLAIEYDRENGAIPNDWGCVVHHTDADSVLSSSIMRGILPLDDEFDKAAIAADHTGVENKIADLLQAIQDRRDPGYSLEQLQSLMAGEPLDGEAQKALEKRYADREKIRKIVENGGFKTVGDVTYAVLEEKIDGALAPALLSGAKLVLLFSPMKGDPSRRDPGFGGCWNAGGNKRNGGTGMDSDEYAAQIAELVENYLKN